MKIAITDIETSGLDSKKHEIIEIGCVIFDPATHEILDQFELKVKPQYPENGDPRAYEVNGYTPEKWEDSISLQEAMEIYSNRTAGAYFCAHNATFDYGFITEAFYKTGTINRLGKYKLCTMSMSWGTYENISLKAMCENFGIEAEGDVHHAINGALKCFEVYKKLFPKYI